MKITRDEPTFRPVTIRIESQDELDKLLTIIDNVACNRINHAPPVLRAAIDLGDRLFTIINED